MASLDITRAIGLIKRAFGTSAVDARGTMPEAERLKNALIRVGISDDEVLAANGVARWSEADTKTLQHCLETATANRLSKIERLDLLRSRFKHLNVPGPVTEEGYGGLKADFVIFDELSEIESRLLPHSERSSEAQLAEELAGLEQETDPNFGRF